MRSVERGAPSYAGRVERLFEEDGDLAIWFERASTVYDRDHLRAVGTVIRVRAEMRGRDLAMRTTKLPAIADALFYLAGWEDWEEEGQRFRERVEEASQRMREIRTRARSAGSDWEPTQEVLQMDVERPDTTYQEQG